MADRQSKEAAMSGSEQRRHLAECYAGNSRKLLSAIIQGDCSVVKRMRGDPTIAVYLKPSGIRYCDFKLAFSSNNENKALADQPSTLPDKVKKKLKNACTPVEKSLVATVFNTGTNLRRTSWVQEQLLIPRKQRDPSILFYNSDESKSRSKQKKVAQVKKHTHQKEAEVEARQQRRKLGNEEWKKWKAAKEEQRRKAAAAAGNEPTHQSKNENKTKSKDWKEDSIGFLDWKANKLKEEKERQEAQKKEKMKLEEEKLKKIKLREQRAIQLKKKVTDQRRLLSIQTTSEQQYSKSRRKKVVKCVKGRMKPYCDKLTKGENVWEKTLTFSSTLKTVSTESSIDGNNQEVKVSTLWDPNVPIAQLFDALQQQLGIEACEYINNQGTFPQYREITVDTLQTVFGVDSNNNNNHTMSFDKFDESLSNIKLVWDDETIDSFVDSVEDATTIKVKDDELSIPTIVTLLEEHKVKRQVALESAFNKSSQQQSKQSEKQHKSKRINNVSVWKRLQHLVGTCVAKTVELFTELEEMDASSSLLRRIQECCQLALEQSGDPLLQSKQSLVRETLEQVGRCESSLFHMEPIDVTRLRRTITKYLQRKIKHYRIAMKAQRLDQARKRLSMLSPTSTKSVKRSTPSLPQTSLTSLPSILHRSKDIRATLVYSSEEIVRPGKYSSGFSLEGDAFPNHQANRLRAKHMRACAMLSALRLAKPKDVKTLISIQGLSQDQMRTLGGICLSISIAPRWRVIKDEIENWQQSKQKRGGLIHSLSNVGTDQDPEVLQELRRTVRQVSRNQLKHPVLELMYDWLGTYVELVTEVKRQAKDISLNM